MDVDIADFFPLYPSQDDKHIQGILASKAEFQEVASHKKEKVIKEEGKTFYFNHQKSFRRFMQVYNTCFLYGETGIGKTGSFSILARYFQARPHLGIRRAIFITSNDLLKDELKRQLRVQYKAENGQEDENLRRRKGNFFQITTYRAFAGQLKSKFYINNTWAYDALINYYDHSLIFVDEVHKIRKENNEEEDKEKKLVNIVETRKIFHDFFHRLKFSKIILSSGTPMINDPKEIVDLFNLILPLDKQIPKDFDFDNATLESLQPYFNGRICYVKALDTIINRVVKGEVIVKDKVPIKVFKTEMSKFQYDAYRGFRGDKDEVVDEGDDDEKPSYDVESADNFISKSRQAATFVFPNGKLAQFNEYFESERVGQPGKGKRDQVNSFIRYNPKKAFFDYLIEELRFNKEEKKEFNDLTSEEKVHYFVTKVKSEDKLKAIRKLSCVFAKAIEIDLKSPGCAFANDVHTKASGVLVFAKILELFGYSPFEEMVSPIIQEKGESKIKPSFKPALRYAVLTSETPNVLKNFMLEVWNHPDNYDGRYIKMFITSPTGDTGINLNHVRRIYSFPSPWNLSSQHQTDTRAIRATSHNVLLSKLGIEKVDVDIYYFYASGPNGEETVGLKMYKDAAIKDLKIKKIESVMKRLAYNGLFDQERNQIKGLVDEDYKIVTDYSNYDTLYADDLIFKCSQDLEALFRKRGYYHLYEIKELLNSYRSNIILRTLSQYIGTQRVILNSLNFPCILRVNNDIYTLSNDFKTTTSSFAGLGFYNDLVLTQEVKVDTFKVSEERVQKIASSFFATKGWEEEKKIHREIDNLVNSPPELIALLEESISLQASSSSPPLAAKVMLERFKFAWYRCNDLSDEVKVTKGKKGEGARKVKDMLTEEEKKDNDNGNIYFHIMLSYFSTKEAGFIDSIRNPKLKLMKYRDPKDGKWKMFDNVADYTPYNNFVQKYQNYYLSKYEPVYCIVSHSTDRNKLRIVDTCKREVRGKVDRSEEDARIHSKGRIIGTYYTEDIIDAIYNCAPDTILKKYIKRGEALAKKDDRVDTLLNQAQYKGTLAERGKFKYNPSNTYSLERKKFRLGFYDTHINDNKATIDKILINILFDIGHVVDFGLTNERLNTNPIKIEREYCQ